MEFTKYMHADHLGSITAITDESGNVLERLSFDAFGNPRNPDGTDAAGLVSAQTTRGYTGHEMDAESGLINMNARLYDPVLGRFLSADTIVPNPGDTQGFNRYSYVKNNPLKYVDPTGHGWWSKFRDNVLKPVITIVAAVTIAVLTYGIVQPYITASLLAPGIGYGAGVAAVTTGAVVGGAAAGFAAGITSAAINGANSSEIWKSGVMGAFGGAVSFGLYAGFVGIGAPSVLGTMVGAGFGSVAQGGNSESLIWNFIAAGMSEAAGNAYREYVGFDVDVRPGGEAVERSPLARAVLGPNSIGSQGFAIPKPNEWEYWLTTREGSFISKALNLVPGINATSKMHDNFQVGLDLWGGSTARSILNVPGMLPAAAITYAAAIYSVPIPVIDQLKISP